MKDFVDYKIAKELKELGFDGECCYYFTPDTKVEITHFPIEERNSTYKHNEISQPTYYQVFQWFREVHNIDSSIYSECIGSGHSDFVYAYNVCYFTPEEESKKRPKRTIIDSFSAYGGTYSGGWDNYRECEVACIEYMINLVKNETSTA